MTDNVYAQARNQYGRNELAPDEGKRQDYFSLHGVGHTTPKQHPWEIWLPSMLSVHFAICPAALLNEKPVVAGRHTRHMSVMVDACLAAGR